MPLDIKQRRIPTLVRGRVLDVERPNPLNEALHAALLENTHQGRSKSLASVRRDLGHSRLGAGPLLHITTGNLLELEISGNVGRDKDVGKLARGHQELGHQVNVPVVEAAILFPRLRALGKVAILLEQNLEVD